MDLKGLPQTVQNFIEETIQNRENGKFPDNETCQKVMEYAADTGSQKLAGLGLYYLAEYYWQNDQYENTLQCLTESIGYLKNEQMYELLARTYNMMGAVSDRKNNRMVALSSYYNCLQYAEKYHFSSFFRFEGVYHHGCCHIVATGKNAAGRSGDQMAA